MNNRRTARAFYAAKAAEFTSRPSGLFVISPNTRIKKPEAIFLRADCIFFDVGSTLIDETAAYSRRALEMLRGTDVSFAAFDRKRTEFFAQGLDGNSEAVRFFRLTKSRGIRKTNAPSPTHAKRLPFSIAPAIGWKSSQTSRRALRIGSPHGANAVPRHNRRIGRAGRFQARPAHL